MIDIEAMIQAALKRINERINRSAAQHLRTMRRLWREKQ